MALLGQRVTRLQETFPPNLVCRSFQEPRIASQVVAWAPMAAVIPISRTQPVVCGSLGLPQGADEDGRTFHRSCRTPRRRTAPRASARRGATKRGYRLASDIAANRKLAGIGMGQCLLQLLFQIPDFLALFWASEVLIRERNAHEHRLLVRLTRVLVVVWHYQEGYIVSNVQRHRHKPPRLLVRKRRRPDSGQAGRSPSRIARSTGSTRGAHRLANELT